MILLRWSIDIAKNLIIKMGWIYCALNFTWKTKKKANFFIHFKLNLKFSIQIYPYNHTKISTSPPNVYICREHKKKSNFQDFLVCENEKQKNFHFQGRFRGRFNVRAKNFLVFSRQTRDAKF